MKKINTHELMDLWLDPELVPNPFAYMNKYLLLRISSQRGLRYEKTTLVAQNRKLYLRQIHIAKSWDLLKKLLLLRCIQVLLLVTSFNYSCKQFLAKHFPASSLQKSQKNPIILNLFNFMCIQPYQCHKQEI